MKKFFLFLAICVIAACQPTARTLGASGGTASPIIPASWTVAAWFIDPANSSGTASDSNNCTTSATACLTWHQINDVRWGCQGSPIGCPRLQQTTAIEFLSSQSTNADLVYFFPTIENGAVVQIFGPLGASQQIASGVLSNVTAKNRATPQLLLAQSGVTAVGQLVVNSTHPSRAWAYKLSSGAIYSMTEPETPVVIPSSQFACASEVDTWTNGDSVVVYQPVKINIAAVSPIFEGFGTNNAPVYIYNIAIADLAAAANITAISGSVLWESSISKQMAATPALSPQPLTQCNAFMSSNVSSFISSTGGSTPPLFFKAGAMTGVNSLTNTGFFDDIILAGQTGIGSSFSGGSGAGAFVAVGIYIETAKTLTISSQFNGTNTIFWGPGTLNVTGSGRLVYTSTATANLLTTLQLNGSTTAHSIFTTANVDTPCGGITINKANLDAAASATCATTGFGGLAFNPGGASMTTGGL